MKVYLDNNILVDIEDGKYSSADFLASSQVEYYYSESHIWELINGLVKHPELKDIRLNTLERLCGTNYISPDVACFKMSFKEQTPQDVFEQEMRFICLHNEINRMSESMRINRDGFLAELNLVKIEVGNYKPSEIFYVLDKKLKENWGYGIEVYLEKSLASTGRTKFNSLFNLLDFACYWRDKSNEARLNDASHACFAQMCDMLVSNDRRMRVKAEATYSYVGVKTKVLPGDEFVRMLRAEFCCNEMP